jgi:hypothetical protein
LIRGWDTKDSGVPIGGDSRTAHAKYVDGKKTFRKDTTILDFFWRFIVICGQKVQDLRGEGHGHYLGGSQRLLEEE